MSSTSNTMLSNGALAENRPGTPTPKAKSKRLNLIQREIFLNSFSQLLIKTEINRMNEDRIQSRLSKMEDRDSVPLKEVRHRTEEPDYRWPLSTTNSL